MLGLALRHTVNDLREMISAESQCSLLNLPKYLHNPKIRLEGTAVGWQGTQEQLLYIETHSTMILAE